MTAPDLIGRHTPGPWQAIGTDPGEGGDWYWIKAQPNRAMRGFTKEIGVVNGSQSDPEQAANARLISAAPTMAKQGQFLIDRLDEFERELLDDDVAAQFFGHVLPALARFRKTIEQALGNSHD